MEDHHFFTGYCQICGNGNGKESEGCDEFFENKADGN